jgi:hypothetical protein
MRARIARLIPALEPLYITRSVRWDIQNLALADASGWYCSAFLIEESSAAPLY